MEIKILGYKGISWTSKLIRWQTRSDYSHVAFLMHDGTVIEAWHKGGVRHVASFREAHTPGTEVDVFRITGKYDYDKIERFLKKQLGKKYDFKSVFRFVTRRKVQLDDKWFCAEFVEVSTLSGGLSLLRGNPSEHSPRDTLMTPLIELEDTWTV